MEEKYLVMVDPYDNHNKFYRMIPNVNGTSWTAEYGRVGAAGLKRIYPITKFMEKYQEKLNKGYEDQTMLHSSVSEVVTAASKYTPITCISVRALIDKMLEWADKVIAKNYTVSKDTVTKMAIDEAQKYIDILSKASSVYAFNDILVKIYSVIPRKMSDVSESLAKSTNDFPEIISREQDLLDTMSGRISVQTSKTAKTVPADAKPAGNTILDVYGLAARECSAKEIAEIKSHLDPETAGMFKTAWHVENKESRKKFDEYCKRKKIGKSGIKYYYHGSRNQNYWNIAVQSLKLRPNQNVQRSGAMFGHGLYFAPKAKKSVGYTSLTGTYWAHGTENTALLMIFKVAMGKAMDLNAYSAKVATWNESDCEKAGYNSVYAHAGVDLRNDECIVYNEDACTLSYIVELKK